ncbi:hypothetical protein [Cyanobacterium aponinum]|nr:hypothetical protein [Cyanobacterium aponinum]
MNSLSQIENIALKIRRSPLLQNLPIWKLTREVYLYPNLFF